MLQGMASILGRGAKGAAAVGGTALVGFCADHCWLRRRLVDRSGTLPPQGSSVVVLGGGVVGVASAAVLARAGFAVTVLEQHSSTGKGASAVNAGTVRVSTYTPVVMTSTLMRIAASWGDDPVYRVDWPLSFFDLDFWRWGVRFVLVALSASSEEGCPQGDFLLSNSPYFVRATNQAAEGEGLAPPLRRTQSMNVYIQDPLDPGAAESGRKQAARAKARGVCVEPLETGEVLAIEPALGELCKQRAVDGGVVASHDRSGDCELFVQQLARRIADRYGVRFITDCRVTEVVTDAGGEAVRCVRTEAGVEVSADAFVVASGCGSVPLLRQLGIYVPIYPVKGYSLTFPASALAGIKLSMESLVFWPLSLYVTQFADDGGERRIRCTSIAEWAGWDEVRPTPQCVETLRGRISTALPQLKDAAFDAAELRVGARPWTVDDLPIVSGTPYKNLYVNTGHGHYGWRLACGTAEQLLCLMTGRALPLDQELLSIERFRGLWRAAAKAEACSGRIVA